MNKLDLTKTGGFPFTQDMLDWLQQNSLAVMNMLGAKLLPDSLANTANTPVALVGINPNGGYVYKAGWLWYNNEILHFPTDIDTSGLPTLTGGLVYGFAIQEVDTPVAYFDGSSHNTKISRTVTIASGANTLTASFIPLTTTIYYFATGLRETEWNTVSITGTSGIGGNYSYRKNFLSNTLQFELSVSINSLTIAPGYIGGIAQLPAGYRPLNTRYYAGMIIPAALTNIYDNQTPQAPIVAIPIWVDTSGYINIRVYPVSGGGSYGFFLSTTIPLD